MILFIARARNSGVTKEFLAEVPVDKRYKFATKYDFGDSDAKIIASKWNCLSAHATAEEQKRLAINEKVRIDIPQEDDPEGAKARVPEIDCLCE